MVCYVLATVMGAKDVQLSDFHPFMATEPRIMSGRDFSERRATLPKQMTNEEIEKLWREKGRGEVERLRN